MLRSTAFNLAFYLWAVLINVAYIPALVGPSRWVVAGQAVWARGVLALLRWLAGVRLELRGRQHFPKGAVIIASKHQSVFETIAYHLLLDDPAVVLKKELLSIPIYGWYCRKSKMIPVDRSGGAKALKVMLGAAHAAAAEGRPIVIFPEGTRTAPGTEKPYQPGVAGLYRALGVPVVPVALNSGLFWPRRQFRRRPGTIVVEFLEPIPPGLAKADFMARLHDAIEPASRRLEREAGLDKGLWKTPA